MGKWFSQESSQDSHTAAGCKGNIGKGGGERDGILGKRQPQARPGSGNWTQEACRSACSGGRGYIQVLHLPCVN